MDEAPPAHYIARRMNLLLLLSALLSAITGVSAGARAPVATGQVVRAAEAVATTVAAIPAAPHRPAQAFDGTRARLRAAAVVRLPVLAIPAWASRRRE